MKEYNWREERKRFMGDSDEAPVNQPVTRPAQSSSGLKICCIIFGALILIAGGIFAGYAISSRNRIRNMKYDESADTALLNAVRLSVTQKQKNQNKADDPAITVPPEERNRNFEDVLGRIQYNVGVVCVRFEFNNNLVMLEPLGTAWAFGPQSFATNAHVAHALHEFPPAMLKVYALKMLCQIYRVQTVAQLKAVIGKKLVTAVVEKARAVVIKQLMQKYGCSTMEQLKAKIPEKQLSQLIANGTAQLLMAQYHASSYEQALNKIREQAFERTLAATMEEIKGKSVFSAVILINKQAHKYFTIQSVQVHALYNSALSPDVAVLNIREKTGSYFKIASQKKLFSLKQGRKIAFLGFPMENIVNNNLNTTSPIATFQEGNIIALSDFDFKEVRPEQSYLVRHNLSSAGGASGSPIFDLDGEVVALLNCNLGYNGQIMQYLKTRVDSGAQVRGAIRVDLLEGVGEAVEIKTWINKDL